MSFSLLTPLLDAIPHRVAALGAMLGGALMAVAAPVAEEPAVGYVGLATVVVTGIVGVAKIFADARKNAADRRSNADHRDDCHEQLKATRGELRDAKDDLRLMGERLESLWDKMQPKKPPAMASKPLPPSEHRPKPHPDAPTR